MDPAARAASTEPADTYTQAIFPMERAEAVGAVERAAAKACHASGGHDSDGQGNDDLQLSHDWLVVAVRQALCGREPCLPPLTFTVRARELLGEMRREVLADRDDDPSADTTVEILRAMERVEHALSADPGQRLINQFSGSDALELLVEVAHDMRSPLNASTSTTRRTTSRRCCWRRTPRPSSHRCSSSS